MTMKILLVRDRYLAECFYSPAPPGMRRAVKKMFRRRGRIVARQQIAAGMAEYEEEAQERERDNFCGVDWAVEEDSHYIPRPRLTLADYVQRVLQRA